MPIPSMLIQDTRATGVTTGTYIDLSGSLTKFGDDVVVGETGFDGESHRQSNRVIAVVCLDSGVASIELFQCGGRDGIFRYNQSGGDFPSGALNDTWSNWRKDGGFPWALDFVDHGAVTTGNPAGVLEAGETVTSTSGGSGTISISSKRGIRLVGGYTGTFLDGDTLTQTTGTYAGATATAEGNVFNGEHQTSTVADGQSIHTGLHVITWGGKPYLCTFWRHATITNRYRGAYLDLTDISTGWQLRPAVTFAGFEVIENASAGNSARGGFGREWVFDGAIHTLGASGVGSWIQHVAWNPETNSYFGDDLNGVMAWNISKAVAIHDNQMWLQTISSGNAFNLHYWNGTSWPLEQGAPAWLGGTEVDPSQVDQQRRQTAFFSDGIDAWWITIGSVNGNASQARAGAHRMRGLEHLRNRSGAAVQHRIDITCVADVAQSLAGKYFWITIGGTAVRYVWYRVSLTGADPAPTAASTGNHRSTAGILVDIATNDDADTVASATRAAIDAALSASYVVGGTGAVVEVGQAVGVEIFWLVQADGSLGADVNTGFTVANGVLGSCQVQDFSTEVLHPNLLSATGSQQKWFYPILDNEGTPGQTDIYIFHHDTNPTTGVSGTYYKWNVTPGVDPTVANVMTIVGSGGDNRHARPNVFPQGGERFWVAGKQSISITGTGVVVGGQELTYYPVGGTLNQTVRIYYNKGQTPLLTQAELAGTATGGGTRVGNEVQGVDADGAARTVIVKIPQAGLDVGDSVTYYARLTAP